MNHSPVIEIESLVHRFGDRTALNNVTYSVEPGEIFGLLGPNGAGKTTTIRLLNGLYQQSAGTIKVFGEPPSAKGVDIRRQTGVLTETNALYERLSARQNLSFFGTLYGMSSADLGARIEEMLKFFNLTSRADDKVGTYSKGMKQRLALARAMLNRPRILFLDEPTSSLDPESTQQVHELIQSIREQDGHTVFLCTHRLEEAEKLADRVAILNSGRLLALGSLEELVQKNNPGLVVEIDFYTNGKPFNLQNIAGISEVEQQNQKIIFKAEEEAVIPLVVEELVKQKAAIYQVQPKKVTLEDIYFELQENARRGAL